MDAEPDHWGQIDAMRFSPTMIDSQNAVVADARALPAAVAEFYR
jgi:hypothetical protein